MRKIVVALVLAFVFFSCDNGDVETETNPYPDGMYPFEVSNITHTTEYDVFSAQHGYGTEFVITWDNPDDNDFRRVEYQAYFIHVSNGESIPLPGEYPTDYPFTISLSEKDCLTIFSRMGETQYVVIKCVDRFGNISQGVRYEYCKYN